MHWPTSALGRPVAAQHRDQVGGLRRLAAVEQAALSGSPAVAIRAACRSTRSTASLRRRRGCARSRCRAATPDSWLTTACQRGQVQRGVVGLGQHPAGPGQRDPQRELRDERRDGPTAPRCRTRPGWPARGGCPGSGRAGPGPRAACTASSVTASRPAEQHLELVDRPRRSAASARPGPRRAARPAWSPRTAWPPRPGGAARRRGAAAAPARTRGRC